MRTGIGYLCRACYRKRVSHYCLNFGRDSKAGKGVEKINNRKKERLNMCPKAIRCHWHKEAAGRLTRRRASYVIG